MPRKREPVYSRLEEVHRTNRDLFILIVTTIFLGVLLSLLSDSIYDLFIKPSTCRTIWWEIGVIVLVTIILIWTFPRCRESREAQIEIWFPYLIRNKEISIIKRSSYQVTGFAKLFFGTRFGRSSPDDRNIYEEWMNAKQENIPFDIFIKQDQIQLIQVLILQVLHMYGDASFGHEADFKWWKSNLKSDHVLLKKLNEGLINDPFLQANFNLDEWKFWIPKRTKFIIQRQKHSENISWQIKHKYGVIELIPLQRLSLAGKGHQPTQVLLQREKLKETDEVIVVGAKINAMVRFKRTWFRQQSSEFHLWATGFITLLQESLDFYRYLEERRNKIIADLDWKIGYLPKQLSIWKKLEEIQRLINSKTNKLK